MAKKLFLDRHREFPTSEVPSLTEERTEPETVLPDRSSPDHEISVELPFEILDETSKSYPKFNATGRSLLIKFNPPREEQDPTTYLKECITGLTNYLVDEVPNRDMVGLTIRNTENVEDKVVGISLRRRDQLKPDVVWQVLGKVIQSNARFGLTDRLEVRLDHVRMPVGNGRNAEKTKGRSIDVMSAIKRSIVVVKGAFLCLAHALIIAMARVNGDPKYAVYRHGKGLKEPVEELLKASGVDLTNGGGLEELQQFQDHLSDYKIVVYDGLSPDRLIFTGNSLSDKKLYLLYDAETGHYNVITNIKAAMAKRFVCNACDALYDRTHTCDKACSLCTATPPCAKGDSRYCAACNRIFPSEKCFQNHLTLRVKGKLVCQWKQVCRNCSFVVTSDNKHECFKKFCNLCNKIQPSGHLCYMAPLKPSRLSNRFMYVFFDTECTQDLEKRDGSFEHVPNLICAQQMCSKCETNDDLSTDCEQCGKRVHVFWQDPIGKFIDYLRLSRPFADKLYVISHNSRGYDAQFLLRRFLELRWIPKLIMDGTKILCMSVEHICFVDSLNFIPMSLKNMPKSFDLTCRKGYYPHYFNTAENLDYVGSYPEPMFYGADFMSSDERSRFLQWYEEQKDKIFHNKEELLAYCMDDVNVLRQACTAFRNLFLNLVKMDPFREAITISSICNKVFRTMFLKPDTVGLIPRGGYRMGDRQSVEALQWLAYIGRTKDITCVGNGRGVRLDGVPNLKVDGYCAETREVFEYLGCFWHGCPCMPNRHKLIGNTDETLLSRYEETMARLQKIRDAGYKVVSIWGCEFKKLLRDNLELQKELGSHPYVKNSPINIRDALYGGRTEATKMWYKAKQGEEIHYVDVISLYPYICKYGKFPIGHPKVYVGADCPTDCLARDGIIKCKVLPPRKLYHPVLPYKSNSKLMFPLCCKCADTMQQAGCTHSDEERCIVGTWVIDEVCKAVEMGYSLVEVFEFWEYAVTRYVKDDANSGGLFAQYVNMFLKLKQESSGFPSWVQSEDDKDQYIEDYRRAEGISLDKASISKNAGQRTLAKLKLNSMWGKWAQNQNKTQVSVVTSEKEFYELITCPGTEVTNLIFPNDEVAWVSWKHTEENIATGKNVNVAVAAYVTSQARLKLYQYLSELGESVLYCDTDSVIYIHNVGEPTKVKTGDYLGDLTNELEEFGAGSYIEEFVSGGPKNYAFSVFCPSNGERTTKCKVKGITLNYENSKVVNFTSLRNMILENADPVHVHNPKKIKRKHGGMVVSEPESKEYKVVFKKRRLTDNFDSLPYGY